VIAVAATDQNDNLASFSNFGATSVQVAAPGVNIFSTKPTANAVILLAHPFDGVPANPGYTFGGINSTWGITSMAFFSAPNSLTDSPGGNYLNNTNSTATSPTFSTVNQRGCQLDGRARYSTEPNLDFLVTAASGDGGGTWISMAFLSGSSSGLFEALPLGDIPDGKLNAARFRFNLITDSTVVSDGVYLDNVRALCTSGAPSANDLQFLQGTSMATPHVAGVAGLLFAAKPSLTAAQIRTIILTTVDPVPALAGKVSSGGRVNARAAVVSVVNNFAVTANKAGTGSGLVTSTSSAINCGNTCFAQFPLGTSATLTAQANAGSTFGGWSGGGCSGTGACTLSADATVTATFDAVPASSSDGGGCTIGRGDGKDPLIPAAILLVVLLLVRGMSRRRPYRGAGSNG
jgi:subtilisin family serine protease